MSLSVSFVLGDDDRWEPGLPQWASVRRGLFIASVIYNPTQSNYGGIQGTPAQLRVLAAALTAAADAADQWAEANPPREDT